MIIRSFTLFSEASAYAKLIVKNEHVCADVKRNGDRFDVTVASSVLLNKSTHSSLQENRFLSGTYECSQPREHPIPSKDAKPNKALAAIKLKNILCKYFNYAKRIGVPVNSDWRFGRGNTLDYFFSHIRLGIKIDRDVTSDANTVDLLRPEIDQELLLRRLSITIVRFTFDEISNDSNHILFKFKNAWYEAFAVASLAIKKQKIINASKFQPTILKKQKKTNRGALGYSGGWTSANQGSARLGDTNFKKRYINEGIAGTRSENRSLRALLSSEAKKRSNGK